MMLKKVASAAGIDVSHLRAAHEEADATTEGYERLIIQCRDTDVLLLKCMILKCQMRF